MKQITKPLGGEHRHQEAQMSATADSIYQLLKSYEAQFQPPAPYVYVTVGTLNVDDGTFTGLTTESSTDPEPLEHLPGQTPRNPPPHFEGNTWVSVSIDSRWIETVTVEPAPHVALGPVQLVFNISRALEQGWSVTAAGVTVQANPTQTSLSIDIWDASTASWTIQANGRSHSDSLRIQRPAGLLGGALGAFTIPVLPVTIVYAPPVDSLKMSTATYLQGQTVGQTTDLTTSSDQSHTVPKTVLDTGTFSSVLTYAAGKLFDATDPTGVALIEDGLFSGAATQMGQLSASETQGITDESDTQMTVTTTTSTTVGTGANSGGPGQGDAIYYLHNLRMAWAYYAGGLRLCPIGYTNAVQPVAAIQNNPGVIGLAPQDAASLLALDPFVTGGPGATPPANRFQLRDTWEYGAGVTIHLTDSVTRDTKQTDTHTTYTTDTNSWDAGPILKSLGVGGQDQTTIKISNATGSDVSSTNTIDAQLVSGPTDRFVVTVWYDALFGTFAFQSGTPSSAPSVNPG
jgi:hypothetical protein